MLVERKTFLEVEVKKLKDQFGAKNFSDAKVDIFWRELKNLQYDQVTKIIDHLVGNCKFQPTLNELCEQISLSRENTNYQEKKKQFRELNKSFDLKQQNSVMKKIADLFSTNKLDELTALSKGMNQFIRSCLKCGGDGCVIGLNDKKEEYAFKCDCAAGKEMVETWPTWGSASIGYKLKF